MKKHRFYLKKYKGGWVKDSFDGRDFQWNKVFGTTTPAAEQLPAEWSWWPVCPKEIPEQLDIPSCVSCSFAFLQAFNSKQENGFNDLLSWAFLWANLGDKRLPYGSTYRDNAQICQNNGICVEETYAKEFAINTKFDLQMVPILAYTEALTYRIKNYSYVNWLDFKRALFLKPLIVAVGGNNTTWQDFSKPIVYPGNNNIDWYHSIVIIGWDQNNNWEFVNWWGEERDHGFLDSKYPFEAMLSVQDIKDELLPNKNVMNLYKMASSSTVYLCNEVNLTARAIYSGDAYMALTGDINFAMVKVIDPAVFAKYKLVGRIDIKTI